MRVFWVTVLGGGAGVGGERAFRDRTGGGEDGFCHFFDLSGIG